MRINFLLVVMVTLSACTIAPLPQIIEPAPTPVITPAIPVDTLSIKNSGHLAEILTLTSTSHEPIAALVFANSAQVLMAIHAPSGLLVQWDLASGQQLSTLNVGPVGIGAASFDSEGRWLVTAAGAVPPAVEAGLAPEFDGYRLFDAQIGTLVRDSDSGGLPILPLADVALSADGKWIADVGGGIFIRERATEKSRLAYIMSSDFNRELGRQEIEQTTGTFDAAGEWVAVFSDNGDVRFFGGANFQSQSAVNMGTEPYETGLAMAIDPTRQYIAVVTTQNLVVRELQFTLRSIGLRGLIEESVTSGPAAGLVFSPDGTLLAVSTKSDWQLWSVRERRRLHLEEQGAYSLAFSPDGRLIAVGGTDGVIYVWGIPLNQS